MACAPFLMHICKFCPIQPPCVNSALFSPPCVNSVLFSPPCVKGGTKGGIGVKSCIKNKSHYLR